MYFKFSLRNNPATAQTEGYYRLVESYRNESGRVCHKTLLNVGFIDNIVDIDQLNQIRRILSNRYEEALGQPELFETKSDNAPIVNQLVDDCWKRLVNENRIDICLQETKQPTEKQRRMIDSDTVRNRDIREIGSEWLCYQALEQLQIPDFLVKTGFDDESMRLAITQIISRAVYPASELETSRWIQENSAVCEITKYPLVNLTKDKLYKSSLRLFAYKDEIEQYLSTKTNQLFDLQYMIYLYDLSSTCYEGKMKYSHLAKYGRSKEKRSDCKIVVIDAGIATDDNLQILVDNEFDYICVSRSKLKNYKIVEDSKPVEVEDKKRQKICLQKVENDKYNDYLIKVESEAKRKKEESMNNRFQEGFETGLKAISASLSKKSGIKLEEKIFERIGRLKQRYQSIHRHYNISYDIEIKNITNFSADPNY
jgi:hypothetical protein